MVRWCRAHHPSSCPDLTFELRHQRASSVVSTNNQEATKMRSYTACQQAMLPDLTVQAT